MPQTFFSPFYAGWDTLKNTSRCRNIKIRSGGKCNVFVRNEGTREFFGRKKMEAERRGKPHVVLRMEAVVLAIPLSMACHMTLCPAHLPERNQWQFLWRQGQQHMGGRMAARGGGRRDCWSCTVSVVLFLNIAEMR